MTPQDDTVIHLIANAHLDPVWLWRWQEGSAEIRATVRAVLGFLEADPTLKFTQSSAGDMRWVEQIEPDLLPRIRQLVAEGRWENVGGWWTQPDCNIPSGESFVRQALYAQRWFNDRLGDRAVTGFNLDSFGHHANLPQLLAKAGLRYYMFMRPGRGSHETPIPPGYFIWEGIDGSRVTAFHVYDPYNNGGGEYGRPAMDALLADLREHSGASRMYVWGMGDHGGGITRYGLEWFAAVAREPNMPAFEHATTREAFAAMEREGRALPVFTGELQHTARGCYAAHAEIKQLNRRAEEALLAAERLSAAASGWVAVPFPGPTIAAAWQDVLFNQFHDLLAGTAIREGYQDAREQMGRALFTAEETLNFAQQKIAARVDTRFRGQDPPPFNQEDPRCKHQAVILYNPHAFPVEQIFEPGNVYGGAVHWAVNLRKASCYTADGEECRAQWITLPQLDRDMLPLPADDPPAQADQVLFWGCSQFLFPVKLPPLGYKVLWVSEWSDGPATLADGRVRVEEYTLDNGLLRVEVGTHGIALTDLRSGLPVLRDGGIVPVVYDDTSSTWGPNDGQFGTPAGEFALRSIRVLEHGPLRGRLRLEYAFEHSRLWLDLLLEDGKPTVEIRAKVWWLERRRLLRLNFPVNVQAAQATHEIPYAAIVRDNDGGEEPIQQWIDLSASHAGLAVINNGKYSVSVQDNEIRQVVLRSPPYAFGLGGVPIEYHDEHWYQDQGVQEFRLLLLPHAGDWRQAGVVETARLFNRPLMMHVESDHDGSLPAEGSFVTVEGPVWLSVIKQAEDGRSWIVRAVETLGRPGTGHFALPVLGVNWHAAFTPWEIKTFRITGDTVEEVNLLEMAEGDE